ncbi:MAG: glycosyltransferase family 2 protein [Alphaproteobacteria bacterium]
MKLAGRVAIIVTVRERFGTTVRCLEPLIAHTPRNVPIVLVMPPGGDRIRGRIDALAVRRAIRIVAGDGANTHNADRNLGAQHVPAVEYLVFVENDTIVTRRWLERLVARADATGADLVGPLVLSGRVGENIVHSGGNEFELGPDGDGRIGAIERHRAVGKPLRIAREKVREDFLSDVEFHCFLLRESRFRSLGGFDAASEVCDHMDAGQSIARQGGRLLFAPSATVTYLEHADYDLADMAEHIDRWAAIKARDPVGRFARKYGIDPLSRFMRDKLAWMDYHAEIADIRRRPAADVPPRNLIAATELVHVAELLDAQARAAGFSGMAHTRIVHYAHMAADFLTPAGLPGSVPTLHRSIRAASLLLAHGAPLTPILGALAHATYDVGRFADRRILRRLWRRRPHWRQRYEVSRRIDWRFEALAVDCSLASWAGTPAPTDQATLSAYDSNRATALLIRVADAVAQGMIGAPPPPRTRELAAVAQHARAVLPVLGYGALADDFAVLVTTPETVPKATLAS